MSTERSATRETLCHHWLNWGVPCPFIQRAMKVVDELWNGTSGSHCLKYLAWSCDVYSFVALIAPLALAHYVRIPCQYYDHNTAERFVDTYYTLSTVSNTLVCWYKNSSTVLSILQIARNGSAKARLGVRDFEIHWISRGFWISDWISVFHIDFSGFLDSKADFWISKPISKRISAFQSRFLDNCKVDSGFCLKN